MCESWIVRWPSAVTNISVHSMYNNVAFPYRFIVRPSNVKVSNAFIYFFYYLLFNTYLYTYFLLLYVSDVRKPRLLPPRLD